MDETELGLAADVLPRRADGEILDPVAVEVAGGKTRAKVIVGVCIAGNPAIVLGAHLLSQRREAVVRAENDEDGAGIDHRAPVLARRADRQVVAAVVVPVTRDERMTELVARLVLRRAEIPLRPETVGGRAGRRRQPGGGAVEDVDRAGVADRPDILAGDADCEVEVAVAVEVPGGHRVAEEVVLLERADDAPRTLAPVLGLGFDQPADRAVEHQHRSGARADREVHRDDVAVRDSDGQVREAVVVEIRGGERLSEAVAGSGVLARRAVQIPHLAVRREEPCGPPIDHRHRSGLGCRSDRFPRRAHGQVERAVAVEIAGGQSLAEPLECRGQAGNTAGVLLQDLRAWNAQLRLCRRTPPRAGQESRSCGEDGCTRIPGRKREHRSCRS